MEEFALGDFGVAKKFEAVGAGKIEDSGIGAIQSRIRRSLPSDQQDDADILKAITDEFTGRWERAIDARLKAYIIMDKEERTRAIKRTSAEVGSYRAILDAANELFDRKEEDGEGTEEIIIRNIKFLKALIKKEADLLELQSDTASHDVIEERIRLLKQEIELIEEGQRLAVKVIEGVSNGTFKVVRVDAIDGSTGFFEFGSNFRQEDCLIK